MTSTFGSRTSVYDSADCHRTDSRNRNVASLFEPKIPVEGTSSSWLQSTYLYVDRLLLQLNNVSSVLFVFTLKDLVFVFQFIHLLFDLIDMVVFQLQLFLLSSESFLLVLIEFLFEKLEFRLGTFLSSADLFGMSDQTMVVGFEKTNTFDVREKLVVQLSKLNFLVRRGMLLDTSSA